MKSFITSILLCLPIMVLGQNVFWNQKAGGLTIEEGNDIAISNSGFTYATGYFSSAAQFGNTNLSSNGLSDVYLSKLNPNGSFLWTIGFGGPSVDEGISVSFNETNNQVIVCGHFTDSLQIGSNSFTAQGNQDIFLAAFDTNGLPVWSKSFGSSQLDLVSDMAIDAFGNIVLIGAHSDTLQFTNQSLGHQSQKDVYLAKFSPSGNLIWNQSGVGLGDNTGLEIDTDPSGNIYAGGVFSNNITFDILHTTNGQNAIFLTKFDSAGAEQWFYFLAGSTYNTITGLEADNSGNIFITGDYSGSLSYYGSSTFTQSATYSNEIYILKINTQGVLSGFSSFGSNNELESSSATINSNGDLAISGNFKCQLSEFNTNLGASLFISIGNFDTFVAVYSSNLSPLWQRNTGGRAEDKIRSIQWNANDQIVSTGHFEDYFKWPTSSNFSPSNSALWTHLGCDTTPYCGDPDYHKFQSFLSQGNKDIFIGNFWDPNRSHYDFFKRSGSGCDFSILPSCIEENCPDTVTACGFTEIGMVHYYCPLVAPSLVNLFDPMGNTASPDTFAVAVEDMYSASVTHPDGCFSFHDSIYVKINELPPIPTISDSKGINDHDTVTVNVEACDPDTATLIGHPAPGTSYRWEGPGFPAAGIQDSSVVVSEDGIYTFVTMNADSCESVNWVKVEFYTPFLPVYYQTTHEDTVELCIGDIHAEIQIFDSIDNPDTVNECLLDTNYTIDLNVTISPNATYTTPCNSFVFIYPDTTGWYYLDLEIIRHNFCERDTTYLTDSIYIIAHEPPDVSEFQLEVQGPNIICPNDSIELSVSGAPSPVWYGPGVNGLTDSIVTIYQPGLYGAVCQISITDSNGCTANYYDSDVLSVTYKMSPTIEMSTALICPNDSVEFTSDQTSGITWYLPDGSSDTSLPFFGSLPGDYYAIVNDSDNCNLLSNTVTLVEYTIPFLNFNGDSILCQGDSLTLMVNSSDSSLIEWQAPLSGSQNSVTIFQPGTYTCKITSCGIETYASITIYSPDILSFITGDSVFCEGDSVLLSGPTNMTNYQWWPSGETTSSIYASNSENYILQVADSNGCSGTSDTLHVAEIIIDNEILYPQLGYCDGDSILLTSANNLLEHLWLPSLDSTAQIFASTTGNITLIASDIHGCTDTSSVYVYESEYNATLNLSDSMRFCEGEFIELSLTSPVDDHLSLVWNPTSNTNNPITLTESGTYWATLTDTLGCVFESDSFTLTVDPLNLTLPITSQDTSICIGQPFTAWAQVDSGQLVWLRYPELDTLNIIDSITGTVESDLIFRLYNTSDYCITGATDIYIEAVDCYQPFVPNVFTANGDGYNDVFSVYLQEMTCLDVTIYDRWGRIVYLLDDDNRTWDGTYYKSGEDLSDGVYFYVGIVCDYNGNSIDIKGDVTLLR